MAVRVNSMSKQNEEKRNILVQIYFISAEEKEKKNARRSGRPNTSFFEQQAPQSKQQKKTINVEQRKWK